MGVGIPSTLMVEGDWARQWPYGDHPKPDKKPHRVAFDVEWPFEGKAQPGTVTIDVFPEDGTPALAIAMATRRLSNFGLVTIKGVRIIY